jgi:hypothetical protein
MMSNAQIEALVRDAVAALQRGDASAARAGLEAVTATGRANAQVWMILATTLRQLGDRKAEESALDEVLKLDPRALRALIMKGDLKAAAGDDRGASSFYNSAVRMADSGAALTPELKAEVERARRLAAEAARHYREHLQGWLEQQGIGGGERSKHFQQSLDIMFGDKRIYLQQPSMYYFPGLPQVQFYEREQFDWVAGVEAATADIRRELLAVLEEDGLFRPYLVSDPRRPRSGYHGLVDNPEWSTLYLWENGGPVPGIADRCPRTMETMRSVPLPHITTRAPSILFSLLRPGARIPPHHGVLNSRLICHLPLIVPDRCGFRVGNETRAWEEGKLLVFDDSMEHEAWNDSDRDRVVLIFDVWRPELGEADRRAITTMFEAIDDYPGGRLAPLVTAPA